MELSTLTAISPVDGRYHHQVQHLNEYFSEYGLMKYRVQVEIEYLLFLEKKKFYRCLQMPKNILKNYQKILARMKHNK
jgi:adenylosuccinate lyase